jgi:hypothetical protein
VLEIRGNGFETHAACGVLYPLDQGRQELDLA